ncbi:carbohydrate ABC transporter permease [uncultured Tateyamaria sp.]|uniref:carbohydrate ABC transporter permease n=1 Tax=uncultured Tateyamaria sp. TaxID=455651 RepID=UPI002636304A|nr:carbohydrate ABC transporter permease [uncultured Tateyamaria sp.]
MDHVTNQSRLATGLIWMGAAIMFFPVVWMLLSAFKSPQELLDYPPRLLPDRWSTEFLVYIWTERNFGRMMLNSVFVSSTVTLLTVFSSAYIAYVFREFQFRFRIPLLYLVIATTMIPLPVLVLPHFQIVLWLGWLNTYQALIMPYALWGFGVFLMYQFLAGFPHDLIEAARLDGVSERQIFQHIVLPLMKSPCVALGIITFLHQWESLLWPLVAANSPEMQMLPAGLATFSGDAVESADLFNPYSAALIAAFPLLIAFLIFQRMIVKGIAMTGMK